MSRPADGLEFFQLTDDDGSHVLDAGGFAGRVALYGNGGNDALIAGNANSNSLYGGTGDDTLTVGDEDFNTLDGGDGDDSLTAGDGDSNTLYGDGYYGSSLANGNDALTVGNGNNNALYGDAAYLNQAGVAGGNDVLTVGNGSGNTLYGDGYSGTDVDGGHDALTAGSGGNNNLYGDFQFGTGGSGGNDSLTAGVGAGTSIVGGGGTNAGTFVAGPDDDQIAVRDGSVEVANSTGTTTVSFGGLATLTVDGGAGFDTATVVPPVTPTLSFVNVEFEPSLQPSSNLLPYYATTLTIAGTGFDGVVPGNNAISFDNGVTGTVVASTTTSLTVEVEGIRGLATGTVLNAAVAVNGFSSGSPVPVATFRGATEKVGNTWNVYGTPSGGTLVLTPGTGGTWTATLDGTAYALAAPFNAIQFHANGGTYALAIQGTSGNDAFAVVSPTAVTANGIAIGGDANALSVDGQGGTDAVAGPNAPTSWTVTGSNGVTVAGIAFSNVETLKGGNKSDTLGTSLAGTAWTVTGTAAGSVAGLTFTGMDALAGSGSDSLAGPNAANVWNVTGTGTGNISNVVSFSGMSSASGGNLNDTVAGPNAPTSWTVTGSNGVTVAGIAFSNVETLKGGNKSDTLGTSLAGTAWTVTGTAAGSVAGLTFTGMDALAGSGSDSLAGPNAANVWNVTGTGTGNISNAVAFTGMSSIVGGNQSDAFNVSPGVRDVAIEGGDGSDRLNLVAPGLNVAIGETTLTAAPGGTSVTFSGIEFAHLVGLSVIDEGFLGILV